MVFFRIPFVLMTLGSCREQDVNGAEFGLGMWKWKAKGFLGFRGLLRCAKQGLRSPLWLGRLYFEFEGYTLLYSPNTAGTNPKV